MAKLEKTITIKAPVEKVFNYIDDSTNLPEIWPSLVEVTDVQPLPNGGHTIRWVYKMAGMRFKGTSEITSTFLTNVWSLNPREALRVHRRGRSNPRLMERR